MTADVEQTRKGGSAPENEGSGSGAPVSDPINAYIAGIGDLTRGLRAERGMSRKDLSRHSGISERYLAQLEGGQANISVTLLWQIAEALNVEFEDLLPSQHAPSIQLKPLLSFLERLTLEQQKAAYSLLRRAFTEAPGPAHGIALLGLRGGGKSTLGSLLSRELGLPFVRLGELIEELAGMKTAELFSLAGQKGYRRLEHQAVKQVVERGEPVVVETGGSLVSEQQTLNDVLSSFYTVWIRASPEEHMNRVVAQGDLRPMRDSSESMSDLKRILAEREGYYSAANYVLDTSGRSVEECLRELVEQCRNICGGRPVE
ncbi:MAG: helix-turn-helix transcriptional regulator [Gammaproteobacteria bacterium]|nr:helix-turn-helix transcriptional regulator [Gammaproteobacteria bacterium]